MCATDSFNKRASIMCLSSLSGNAGPDAVKILVGPEQREFLIGRKHLLSSGHVFRQIVDSSRVVLENGRARIVVSLQDQCPDMFELFCYWIVERKGFDDFIDEAEADETEADDICEGLHWDLVNLHLFAAQLQLAEVQDLAMDAIQDLYLRRNWDIVPALVEYVYQECDPGESCRLRKWIVAMTTWVLGGLQRACVADYVQNLFVMCPGYWEDYVNHLLKMSKGRIQFHMKNPQMRLPSNNLRVEGRQFGYRQCSFHTHRSTVGQGQCPHTLPPSLRPTRPPADEDTRSIGSDTSDSFSASSPVSSRGGSPFYLHPDARLCPEKSVRA